jgi:hypothetical protein
MQWIYMCVYVLVWSMQWKHVNNISFFWVYTLFEYMENYIYDTCQTWFCEVELFGWCSHLIDL